MTTTTSDSGQKILAALHTLGRATAADIAKATGLAYSTTTARLRALQSADRVQRHTDDQGRTHWQPHPADAHTLANLPAGGRKLRRRGRSNTSSGNTSSRDRNVTPEADREPSRPIHTGGRRANSSQASAGDPPATSPTSKQPAREKHAGPAAATPGGAAPTPTTASRQPDEDGPRPRRAKGALRAAVLTVLQDHPDQTFKVSQVARHLPGTSSGAIANALDKLVADGNARQVVDKPATYQAE